MDTLITLYLFLLGLIFGSFTLAMVDRMKTNRDWVKGRSECEHCKHKLRPIDLVPVFSWLSTKGACRYCHERLSVQYPLVELSVGAAFVISYVFWPIELSTVSTTLQFIMWLLSLVLLSGLFIFDMRWYLLPNKLVRPLIGLSFVWAFLDITEQGLSYGIFVNYLLAVAVSAGIFLALYLLSSGKWIGDGDVRLAIAIGLFTGSLLEAWLAIFIASVLGIIVALPIMKKTKTEKRLKLKIPFGPVLILALYVTVLFGAGVINWYKLNILYL
jgi:prepilin signal peptidase PulO-like enzyme (type II secretory pathway)